LLGRADELKSAAATGQLEISAAAATSAS